MAAKGAIAKQEIINKILNTFEGSFLCNGGKELRIPMLENGEEMQIKVALTRANDIIGAGAEAKSSIVSNTTDSIDITPAERTRVSELLAQLNAK